MIHARKRPVAKQQVAESYSLPAPVGGLNARDSVSMMPETDAVTLDNLFPSTTSVDLRKGRTDYATFGGSCETVIVYNGAEVFVAVFDDPEYEIIDATNGGAVSTPVVGGSGDTVQALTSARFDYQNFGTIGGQFSILVNGEDTPLLYNGSAWSASTMTGDGLTTANLFTVATYASRLWFAEDGTFDVWYLSASSITGTLTKLPLGPLFRFGGELSNIVTFSADSGSLLADFIAFVSTEGEVVVFSGDDPSSITTWSRFAQFRIGAPVTKGNRAWCKIGNEAVLITRDGAFTMSLAMVADRANTQAAISDKIRNDFNADVVDHGGNFGWAAVLHPTGQKFLVNVPTAALETSRQYVMNTQTKAWCRFTGWDAFCFEATKDTLYFGGDGFLAKADTGLDDAGDPILAEGTQAFSYLGQRGVNKQMTMARPLLTLDGPVTLGLGVDVDFGTAPAGSSVAIAGSAGDPWEVAWDVAWTGAPVIYSAWQSIRGIGFAIAPKISFQATGINLSWSATDLVFQRGGVL